MKVTNKDIENFNELYLTHKTYAAVARLTGFSASTVKKYIVKDYHSKGSTIVKKFDGAPVSINLSDLKFIYNENPNKLIQLTKEEKNDILLLQKEINW